MAHHLVTRGPRLTALLRTFNLCPLELAKEEQKAAIASLRTAYKKLAKEQHPDVAPEDSKVEAAQKFVRLKSDFEEALTLMEEGVRPGEVAPLWAQAAYKQAGGGDTSRPMYRPPTWREGNITNFQHRKEPQFSLETRIKGNFILWTSVFCFLVGFREFLVWSAGSTYAWSPASDCNPFWVRRYRDAWGDEHNKKAAEPKPAEKAKVEAIRNKVTRDVPDFYKKRGISNTRRKTQPRGLGESL